jgi:hypothetical protein
MTQVQLISEITRWPLDTQLSFLETMTHTVRAEMVSTAPAPQPNWSLLRPADALAFPEDPALAALEAEFE